MRLLSRRVESRRAPEGIDASGRRRGSRKIRQLLAIVRGGLLVAFPDQGCRKTVVGLVSVVKVAEAYSRHGDERGGLSRAIEVIASQFVLTDGCGDKGSGCRSRSRVPMGHRAAMRGRRRRRCRGGLGATAEEDWVVVGWDGTAEVLFECASATTAIVVW